VAICHAGSCAKSIGGHASKTIEILSENLVWTASGCRILLHFIL
jgi:hypothetical protein